MNATEQKIISFISQHRLISRGDRILIAFSGGPDSVFLLHFLNKFSKKYRIELGAAHVNHLLRSRDSERDEFFCRAVCMELNIPFYSTRKNVRSLATEKGNSVEIAGRKIRYDFFNKLCRRNKFHKIATAHNADDNTETVFLNLIKGAGLRGMAGIPVKRDNIIRPVLCLEKSEILEYLWKNRFEYRVDESNLSSHYERNFLRNDIIPLIRQKLNPSLYSSVLTTSLNIQNLIKDLDAGAADFRKNILSVKDSGLSVPLDILSGENKSLTAYALKNLIENNFNVKTESGDIKKILALAEKQAGKSEQLSHNLIVQRERNRIEVRKFSTIENFKAVELSAGGKVIINNRRLSIRNVPLKSVKIGVSKDTEFIDSDKSKGKFTVREWLPGDKFRPIGMHGTKKVSDYLNDIKLSPFEKKSQLILADNGRIVWVIGRRLDDRFKVSAKTKKVLQLCLK